MPSPSLNANNKPSWRARLTRGFSAVIHPELYEQEQGGIRMTRYGVVRTVKTKDGRSQFGEFSGGSGNQFVIERPGGGNSIDQERLLGNNKGFVYAAVNAKAREVMAIDWRLFKVDGDDHEEQEDHDLLSLLDAPNDNMSGLELKYLTSALLDLQGNTYWYLEGVNGPLDKPKAIHLMPAAKVHPVIDRRSWPHQLMGYRMKLLTYETVFKPYEVLHFRLPNVANFFEGYSPTEAGAEFIDNDHYAQEFNRLFFINGARPAGFLETEMIAETQMESLKIGFADVHQGVANMNRIGILPKGVKWSPTGSSPKDMDFKNLSEDGKERTLAMFGVSRTILGTAESDTNRATAETADYVFSKRVVKPHMILICGTINDGLVPRYGDDLYTSFIDPVPEDKAARNEEMKTVVGGQPVLTVNEARDEFMGLGPVEGGDTLMAPTTMAPVGSPQGEGDVTPKPEGGDPNSKAVRKDIKPNHTKAANGLRVAFRPARTKLQKLAKKRAEMRDELTAKIRAALKAKLDQPSKKFISTKEQDETRWKEWSEYVQAAEKDIADTVRKINGEQKAQVLENLPGAVTKGINPADLFNIDKWISITVDALTPTMETLFGEQAKHAAAEVGATFDFTDTTRAAVKRSVQMMSESYQQTTLATLESHINDGVQAGESLADITKRVEQIYEWSDEKRAAVVAKTESFRTANDALKTAWQQSGVVKTVRWYTAENAKVCAYCQEMDGKVIPIDDNFFNNGDSLTVGEGDSAQTMSLDYGDVENPPIHPNCMCMIRPEDIEI
jgi:HK97 family phage portal protein